jgi:LDH2 family malate/lactate/ureidoglycolate dehydrogenase
MLATRVVQADALRGFAEQVLIAVGMSEADAAISADAMLWGELRGLSHHGVAGKLPNLVARIRGGGTDPRAQLEVLVDTPAMALYDGHAGWGQVVATRAMEAAVARARTTGVAVSIVRNSSSPAALGYYPSVAADQGMVGVAIANAVPTMAPWNGAALFIGNQPHAIAAPSSSHGTVVFDGALSGVSTGTIHDHQEHAEPLPAGVALTRSGEPTTDPNEAAKGILLPSGAHRGSGLAIMWEILTGVLAGSAAMLGGVGGPNDLGRPQQVSLFLLALEPAFFMPADDFRRRVDQVIDALHAVKRQPGVERLFFPGERSGELAKRYAAEGIPLSEERIGWLRELGEQTGVPWNP